jgi:hypothetical protein
MSNGLLVAGLLFPAVSFLTAIASLYSRWRYRKYSSPIFIPFVGPVLLTIWALTSQAPGWLIPIVWIGDIGTMAFVIASPRLLSEWWDTCPLTKTLELHGSKGIESATVSFHSTGRYLIRKRWQRSVGELGILGLGELGNFVKSDDYLRMTADHGWQRQLIRTPEGKFQVLEDENVTHDNGDYSLADWILENK